MKGNILCRISLLDLCFECRLIPKGSGRYFIPVPKKMLSVLVPAKEYEIGMEPIEQLSRINHDSPYSKEYPVRKIDGIDVIPIRPGFCGHSCVAMLAGVPLSDVIARMGSGHASWSKILEALDYYGISHASKAVYPRGGSCQLPKCCIVRSGNQFLIWYQDSFCGVNDVDPGNIVSYIEVFTD